jgi:ATP-binding cassette, subfamily B, bacterial
MMGTKEDFADPAALKRAIPGNLRNSGAFIGRYVSVWRRSVSVLVLLVVLAAGCAVAVQYQMKFLVDAMAGPHHSARAVWGVLICFIALIGLESLLWRLCGWLTCRTTIGIGVRMRLDLFQYLSGQSIRYFTENLAGSLGQRVTSTAGAFGSLANTVVWRIMPPVVDFAGGLAIFASIDWHMAAVMGVYVLTITGVLIYVGRRGRALHAAYFGKASEVAGDLIDVIANMWAVKAFSIRRRECERLQARIDHEALAQRNSWMYTERTRVFYDLVLWIMAAVMLLWSVYRWSRGAITPGDVVVVSGLTFRILHGSRDVALAYAEAVQQIGFIDETLRVVGQVHSISDPPDSVTARRGKGAVEFRGVTFGYDPGEPVLEHVDMLIRPGEKVGIVGPSGAGKSSIVHLIQRLHEVCAGEILIDGQPIKHVTQDSLRSVLSVVPQEITLFHRTIMENIRVGRPDASEEEIHAAARAAHCEAFIRRLPMGYATLVGERGVKLSGGQRQRIGIARAFLKDAAILILDEATSALDSESEMQIQQNIVMSLEGRTVIAVAHRLSTLTAFDRILVVAHGRIVEEGSAHELRSRGRLFEKMWRQQTDGLVLPAQHGAEASRRARSPHGGTDPLEREFRGAVRE